MQGLWKDIKTLQTPREAHTDITLIKTTDELCEHMHQYLNKMLLRSFYYVKDISNPSHGPRLFRAVRHLNSYNIYIKK